MYYKFGNEVFRLQRTEQNGKRRRLGEYLALASYEHLWLYLDFVHEVLHSNICEMSWTHALISVLLALVKNIGQVASTAVLSVVHSSHEDTSTAVGVGALSSKSLNLAIAIDLVVLEHSQLRLLALVLDLLGGAVHLLLSLLGTTSETEDKVKSRLLLDVVVGECAAVFELLAGED